jgi:hypothetical protein
MTMKQAILVLLVGCGPATAGIPDSSMSSLNTSSPSDGGPGGTGTDTDNPSGVVWVDAEGTVVEEVVELPEGIAYEDEFGFFWALDPNGEGTGAFVPFPDAGYIDLDYVDTHCSERWVLGKILPPRYVMRGPGGGQSFAALDDAIPEDFERVYGQYGGDCREFFTSAQGLSFDDVADAQMPNVYWVPPLHAETL